jgi:hypothetical protein
MVEEFVGFPKIPRYSRECIVTEKIDGTNAQIFINEEGQFYPGSRSRWITPDNDNHGFARWAFDHREELTHGLGPGRHFGEWWGQGIQRNYGLKEKRFSLFNVGRWIEEECHRENDKQSVPPLCCYIVPVIYRGPFITHRIQMSLEDLVSFGSRAVPGFMNPEGIVIFHIASGYLFKKTIKGDEKGKTE